MSRFAAPWSTGVKVMSALGSAILLGGAGILATSAPSPVLFLLPLAILLACALFTVRGYELEGTDLLVLRLLGSTRLDLSSLKAAWANPKAMTRSFRLLGNGGLFSISGLYYNKTLGRYRAFATDPARSVVLALADRILVITPASPPDFLEALRGRGFGDAVEVGRARAAAE